MSFTLWAEPVRAPGTAASNPTSPAVQSSFIDIECCDIFGPSCSMNSRLSDAFHLSSDPRLATLPRACADVGHLQINRFQRHATASSNEPSLVEETRSAWLAILHASTQWRHPDRRVADRGRRTGARPLRKRAACLRGSGVRKAYPPREQGPEHGVPSRSRLAAVQLLGAHQLSTRPHSASSTSSASTVWPIPGFSERTVTRALIRRPSTGSAIMSPYPGIGRP